MVGQGSKLPVAPQVGFPRDAELGLRVGDWVEVLDDVLEARDGRGELARISNIDEAAREVTLEGSLPAIDMDAHPRLLRWDQVAKADEAGVALPELVDRLVGLALS